MAVNYRLRADSRVVKGDHLHHPKLAGGEGGVRGKPIVECGLHKSYTGLHLAYLSRYDTTKDSTPQTAS
jgi:hypothetical protein